MAHSTTEAGSPGAEALANGNGEHRPQTGFWALTIGSVGVVYGDIGTSPLYAFREAVSAAAAGGAVTREIVLGVLSLIVWSLIIVVTLKYVVILLRADNNGEGGTLSLTALAFRALGRRSSGVIVLGAFGAAMFYGSSLITPALSVLSAVEGLKYSTKNFEPFVLPITICILIALFAVQSRGTAKVSVFFGPVTVLWFIVMALIGLMHIADDWGVFAAVNPYYAIVFLANNGVIAMITLGAVFLVVTGSEALYADLGHFGRKPIQYAWFGLVLPALLLNYFGQGALVLSQPDAIADPFYRLVPEWALLPMVVLATCATVIASQAVITGAYSLTRQAIQLGLLPRFEIRHTSAEQFGQIYMPRVNTLLLLGVLLLVLMFRSSSELAGAYVLAVAATEWTAAILGFIVIWKHWGWKWWSAALLMLPFAFIDTVFIAAASFKILEGAWVPVIFGGLLVLCMLTAKDPPDRDSVRSAGEQPRKKAAPHRAGHCRIPYQRPGFRAHRTPAQPQAQQGAARAQRYSDRPDRRHATRGGGGAGENHRSFQAFPPDRVEIRLYGNAQCAEGAGHRPQEGLAIRHHVHLVFPVPALVEAFTPFRHAALARPAIH
jgi:KUP system potassium uptake protein